MSDYISRDAALRVIMYDGCTAKNVESILRLPSADVAPVVRGRWTPCGYADGWVYCSECKCNWQHGVVVACNMNYCPNCGAKMDEEVEE